MKRRLPLVTEQSLANLRQTRIQLASQFDRDLRDRFEKPTITCKKGCANCCYHPVLITAMEGALLFRWLVSHGKWTPTLRASIKEHATKTKDLSYPVWFLSLIPCPLLDLTKKTCIAYEGRPYMCRVTYSLGDPENCHPHKIQDAALVNKQEVLSLFHKEQGKLAAKHGLQMVLMPISLALILGEKIAQGTLDLEDADMAILREFEGTR